LINCQCRAITVVEVGLIIPAQKAQVVVVNCISTIQLKEKTDQKVKRGDHNIKLQVPQLDLYLIYGHIKKQTSSWHQICQKHELHSPIFIFAFVSSEVQDFKVLIDIVLE
jgi:hypothetical protein